MKRWILGVAAALCLAVAAGLFVGAMLLKKQETGRWEVPTPKEVVDEVVEAVVPPPPPQPSKVIYLDRNPMTLYPGADDAPKYVSGVVQYHHPEGPVKLPGWKGTKKNWTKVVACVKKLFKPFDVVVTDEPPAGDDFIRVAVGGKPKDLNVKDGHTSGLAPFNGGVIPKAVVFAFSAQLRNDVRTTCETIGMEVAHAYGLDHEYLCKDVMTYLSCGARTFVDKEAPCGEHKKRDCKDGAKTQNSYRRLLGVLGPAKVEAPPSKP